MEYAAKVYGAGAARGDGSGYGIQPVYFVALLNTGVPKFDRSDAGIWRDRFVSERRRDLEGQVRVRVHFPGKNLPRGGG